MSETLNLMIVEDVQADFLLIERNLRQHGLAVRCARVASPDELAQALRSGGWDVVLFDDKFPGMGFRTALAEIRAALPDAPVILVSGSVGEEEAVDLLKLGFADFVLKDRLARLAPAVTRSLAEARERRERRAAEEEELRKSRERLDLALSASQMGVWEWDLQTDAMYCSPESLRIMGADGFTDRLDSFTDRIHPDDLQRVMSAATRAAAEGALFCTEFRIVRRDGATRWLSSSGRADYDARGGPLRMFGVVHDITERRLAQDTVKDSAARAEVLLDLVPDAMLLVDAAGRIVRANAQAEALFGYTMAELERRPVEDLIPPRLRERHAGHHATFKRHPHVRRIGEGGPLPALRRDGREFPAEIALGPVSIAGEPHVIVTLIDITARQQAELQLQRFAQIVNTSTDMLAFVDRDLRYQVVNPACAAQFGLQPEQVVGRKVQEMFDDSTWAEIEPQLRAALAGEDAQDKSTRLFADGSRHVLDSSYRPFRANGEVLGVVISGRDTTEHIAAETALARESNRNQLLLRNASDGIHILDHDGKVVEVCESFCSMIGYTRDELIGASVAKWDAKWNEEEVKGIVRHNMASNARNEFETQHRRRDGTLIDVEVSTQPIDLDGQRVLFCSSRDISGRRSAEKALQESESVLEKAQQMAHVGSWTYCVADDGFLVSTECERMFVWPGKRIAAADLFGLIHPHDIDRSRTLWRKCLATGATYEIEHRVVIQGAIKYVHVRGEVAFDAQGRAHKVIGFTQDVTEIREARLALEAHRVQLEELVATRTSELRQQTRYLSTLIDGLPMAVWSTDTEGRVLAANRAAAYATGRRSVADVLGKTAAALMTPEVAAYHCAEDAEVVESGQPTLREINESGRNGEKWSEVYRAPVLDDDGSVLGIVGYLRDVTETKAEQSGRERALAEAERLARVRSEFLANMSHEIRTPLNAVLGLAQVGARESSEARPRETFERIVDSGQLLLGVVNDILDFSKIEAGKLCLERARFNLGEAIDRAVDLTAARAYAKQLDFCVAEAHDLPQTCVGDALRLSQVLVNLLSNAVKFTARGRVALEVTRHRDELILQISDSGIGMSAEQIKRLFVPFEQADGSTTRRFGGTGLGLAISKRLVDLMNGSISADSKPGVGSRFEVRLPLIEASPAPAVPSAATVALAALAQDEVDALRPALERRGVAVNVESADSAVSRAADLIVLDSQALATAGVSAVAQALTHGQCVALVCSAVRRHALPDSMRERVLFFERPLRARHLIAALGRPSPGITLAQPGQPRLPGLRILAAEDNEINRLVLAELLALEGAQLVTVNDGQQALERLAADGAGAYDLMLTDIQMPGIDGYETARRARALAPKLPIIGLTAHAMPEERSRCLAAGMVEHVAKPIDVDLLVATLQRHAPPPVERSLSYPAAEPETGPSGSVDWTQLESQFRGKRDFVNRLAATVLRGHTETSVKLRAATAAGDFATMVFIAHSMKGMFGSLMATRLQEIARRAEEAAREGRADAAALCLDLASAIDALIESATRRLSDTEAQVKSA